MIRILSVPGWRLRVWLAVVITLVLAGLPLPVAGLVLWIGGLLGMTLMEAIAATIREQYQAQRQLDADRERRGQAVLLAERDAQIASLMADLARARSNSGERRETDEERTYRQVGLHPRAPEFLVTAARRAYRSRLHPDRHPGHRSEANSRYLKAEAAFERIAELRR
ncbi:hypothetical protein [Methylobacterium longum]|uniref:Molecular chaperone DnaJ n=1 Tax=Methylobacterium longum TaxID=767694 RepID=A0ABT8AR54_9HYPH|nr:hypothetical protein [Methylobacterium longum]MDN3572346.1 hypothetical protein [Methylobacterium longum]